MAMTLVAYLWRHRERPRLLSRRWFKVWIKRGLMGLPLCRLLFRRYYLALRGATIGPRTVLQSCQFNGRLRHLHIGRDAVVCSGVTIALHAQVRIGDCVVINENVTLLTASHALRDPHWRAYHRPIRIEDHAWIATGAMLLPGVTIGRGAVVGAGAVVRSDVPAYGMAVGNPATVIAGVRSESLDYRPAELCAPYEAWLGPRAHSDAAVATMDTLHERVARDLVS
jgi:maltose O-acetyltransferase